MPKATFLSRYSLIIKRLEKGPATCEQILQYLKDESDIQDKDFIIVQRTLQRDIKDIYAQLNVEIVNEKKGDKRYFISNSPETHEQSQRLLDSYHIINIIRASQDFEKFVFLESRKPRGLDHFYGLLYAIRNKRILNFSHFKYWDESLTYRTVHPLALKESQGRWYLLAVEAKDKMLKTFGLDRMNDIDICNTKFRESYTYDFKELFSHSFGIINDENGKVEHIRLSFKYEQGQYVKTYPLHGSQKILLDNHDEVLIELFVYITYDFVKELLSFGEELTIVSPARLRNQVKKSLVNTLKLYNKSN